MPTALQLSACALRAVERLRLMSLFSRRPLPVSVLGDAMRASLPAMTDADVQVALAKLVGLGAIQQPSPDTVSVSWGGARYSGVGPDEDVWAWTT